MAMLTNTYKRILKKSKDPDALKKAYATPLTKDQVFKLVYAYVDENEVEEIRFTCTKRPGAANSRGKWIRLNPSKLNKGLVLHEIAHIIARNDGHAQKPHDDGFIKVLDGLIWSEIEYEKYGPLVWNAKFLEPE